MTHAVSLAGVLSTSSTSTYGFRHFPQSSFFQDRRAPALPSPAEIRALDPSSNSVRANRRLRPRPVVLPSLRLFVKYGANVTIAEAETQVLMRERLEGQVPIPEVFGWREDAGQVFIYMELVEGDTLQIRFSSMSDKERLAICLEIRPMVNAWRTLSQNGSDRYIGSVGRRPLNDILFHNRPSHRGPFQGLNVVRQFHNAWGIDISADTRVMFTHDDLCPPNILVSRGPNPTVVAILDWGQAGWLPEYWEFCKASRVGVVDKNFGLDLQEVWESKYGPIMIDPVDQEKYYLPWADFMLSNL